MCRTPHHTGSTKPNIKPSKKSVTKLRQLGQLMVLIGALCSAPICGNSQTPPPFRIGFSTTTLGAVNENDAVAAVRIWAQSLVEEKGINADPQPKIFRNINEISTALNEKSIDCINLTSIEYAAIQHLVNGETIVTAVLSNSITEEYILLVHKDSGIAKLEDLKGHTVGMLQSARTVLSSIWIDTLLAQKGLGAASGFFSKIDLQSKIDKAMLPVFFRQMDACIVTKNGYRTMAELNPQMGQYLTILERSPAVIPVVFCFRADYHSPIRDQILQVLSKWHLSNAGRQILTLFQTDSLEIHPIDCLTGTLELLAEHKRYFGRTVPTFTYKSPDVILNRGKAILQEAKHP
jgi:ABC-type phosphate/phosphonate transport system substrate-binding protein